MFRDTKKLTKSGHILLFILAAGELVGTLSKMGKLSYTLYPEYEDYIAEKRLNNRLYQLQKQGWLKFEYKEAKRIIKLTKKGELEALFQKAHTESREGKWDGKWRMGIFDIPENARNVRDQLRRLLKGFGFQALQASVYVYPLALSTAATEFLKKSGLMRYIRFVRVDSFDDDADLRKQFKKLLRKNHGRE